MYEDENNVTLPGFQVAQEVWNVEDDPRKKKAFNEQAWGQHSVHEAGDVWQSLANCLTDNKWVGHEPQKCLEDYHWRFGHVIIKVNHFPEVEAINRALMMEL